MVGSRLPIDNSRTMRNTVRMGQIRQSIPDELHNRLKLMAVEQKVPLRELIERLLTEAAEREQQ